MWFAGPARRAPVAGRPGALRLGFTLRPGMRVGLFGGSFNPAHEGHAHVAETARRRLGLDRVVWLVSPQNPLKSRHETADLPQRMAGARALAQGPGMVISDIETRLGSAYTIDTIRTLKARFPGVHFVWIMGADSLAGFHRWKGWTQIMHEVPVAVVSRPWISLKSRFSPTAKRFAHSRRSSAAAMDLPGSKPPGWVFLRGPLNFQSSTALRERMRRAKA
ncbi:nicotinate-nucleotide adenylyltransferase [Phenylobacterium sp.]|uniref:nicotinate-nucleotide adenylyltransferase n=1 Tax=Phenylobacterium sp. TaxID=1871053 RepID=UPI0025F00419|nr:nicotinate-nucleotide adenylyltransferase [Phenylobacterium sp.]MBX3485198.1 nicotinate-nucleotide adenylyltransferase [Phenylobacterium sp.]MCW5760292.1 nicotinate-nucleotide adenylyltransferase [Phenylobacterium sp.]